MDEETGKSIYVTPLMAHYFTFELEEVIDRMKFREMVEDCKSAADVAVGIEYYRNNTALRPPEEFPPTQY